MTIMHLDNPRSLNFGRSKKRSNQYWIPTLNEDTKAARQNRQVLEGRFTTVPYEYTNKARSVYLSITTKRPKYKHHARNVSGLGG